MVLPPTQTIPYIKMNIANTGEFTTFLPISQKVSTLPSASRTFLKIGLVS
jgi:hypothetical protein